MGMRDAYELLQEMGGTASLKQMREYAKKNDRKVPNISGDMRKLTLWRIVKRIPAAKERDTTWTITGSMEWNVVQE